MSANVWKFPHVAKTNGTPCGHKYKSQSGLKGCSVFIFVHNNSPVKIVIQSLLYSISYLLSNFHKVSYYYAKTSLSKTQKWDVEGTVPYIYCKMFCEICRKQKPSRKWEGFVIRKLIIGRITIIQNLFFCRSR